MEIFSLTIFAKHSISDSEKNQSPDVFFKKGVLKNFAKFTGKHQCQSLFFDKLQGLGLQLYFKKKTLDQVFSCECSKISNNTFLIEHRWWLLLPEYASALVSFCITSSLFKLFRCHLNVPIADIPNNEHL